MGYRLTVAFQAASATLAAGGGSFAMTGGTAALAYSDGSAPAWVASLPDNQWTELTSSQSFSTWATANVTPSSGYLGSAFGPVIDAYSDWVLDEPNKALYITGGGHFDSSNNGVYKFDPSTLTYSVSVPPTPTDKYPPGYVNANGAITYPSGSNTDYFQTTDTLTDPADLPYAAPFAARRATHSYAATGIWNGRLVCHYNLPGYAVLGSSAWENLSSTSPYPAQLYTNGWAYNGSEPLQPGTYCVTDFATGKQWVATTAGDVGDNLRPGIYRINAATQTVEAKFGTDTIGASMVQDSTYVYMATLYSGSTSYNLITRVRKSDGDKTFHGLSGTLCPAPSGSNMEICPGFCDGSYFYLWNYGPERDYIYKISLADFSCTRVALGTSGMPTPSYKYRVHYVADWGVALVLPNSTSKWWALKLA